MPPRLYPRATLAILTALNFFNYIDRSVLFAVQPLVQKEFHRSNAEFGFLTTAFFLVYMITAPVFGFLADRFPRKNLIIGGALVWSAATLLTAFTFNFKELLFRHALVGIGEASFVAIAPAFLSDLFPEHRRGRVLALFFMAIPVGTALGYVIGGMLGPRFGWRAPFYVGAAPGFLLALAMFAIPEPVRGQADALRETTERGTLLGLARNGAFWTATLGMAAMTFALGGLSVWMPTFLSRVRGFSLQGANELVGIVTLIDGVCATLFGGWLGDTMLRRTAGGYYLVSAISLLVGIPAMLVALYSTGSSLIPGIFVAEFLLLMNTGPLNAAVVNSVGAHIRATAIAINLFVIHLLGDALSPWVIGYVADRKPLSLALSTTVFAVVISAAILFYGMRFAPKLQPEHAPGVAAH
ncbi:MAG TPA: MFS transporter [Terriglobales bacterium]|nr:MFS transporter [Terriglobales bacterium]